MKETESTDGANRQEAPAPTSRDRWNPKGAWLLIVILIIYQVVLGLFLLFAFGSLSTTHPRLWVGIIALNGLLSLAVAFVYLGCATLAEFSRLLGLPPTRPNTAPRFLVSGFALGVVAVLSFDPYYRNPGVWFRNVNAMSWMIFLGPLLEEPIFRGYLYPAFRKGYPVWKAVGAILIFTVITHASKMLSSPHHFLFISVLHVILCMLREHNDTLYPALFFHLGYNAVPAFN